MSDFWEVTDEMAGLTTFMLAGGWDINTLLANLSKTLQSWGGGIVILLGIVMMIVGVWQVATGLMSHGKKQTNWFVAIGLLILGGALSMGGWTLIKSFASGGKKTLDDLAAGNSNQIGALSTIIPGLFF